MLHDSGGHQDTVDMKNLTTPRAFSRMQLPVMRHLVNHCRDIRPAGEAEEFPGIADELGDILETGEHQDMVS